MEELFLTTVFSDYFALFDFDMRDFLRLRCVNKCISAIEFELKSTGTEYTICYRGAELLGASFSDNTFTMECCDRLLNCGYSLDNPLYINLKNGVEEFITTASCRAPLVACPIVRSALRLLGVEFHTYKGRVYEYRNDRKLRGWYVEKDADPYPLYKIFGYESLPVAVLRTSCKYSTIRISENVIRAGPIRLYNKRTHKCTHACGCACRRVLSARGHKRAYKRACAREHQCTQAHEHTDACVHKCTSVCARAHAHVHKPEYACGVLSHVHTITCAHPYTFMFGSEIYVTSSSYKEIRVGNEYLHKKLVAVFPVD